MIGLEFVPPDTSRMGDEAFRKLRPDVMAFARERMRALRNAIRMRAPRATGRYADSWEDDAFEEGEEVHGTTGSPLWQRLGRFLEFGTRNMRPQTHVGNSLEDWTRATNRKIDANNG